MNKAMEKLPQLVLEELAEANKVNPPFHSAHEGYAVILEEREESAAAFERMDQVLGDIWGYIKQDDNAMARNFAIALESYALEVAAEAIQVAAMARKFRYTVQDKQAGQTIEPADKNAQSGKRRRRTV